ncbi:adenylosuccinate synthase [Pneumocystis murina B123]|uniref:Adenylosuccinate synthetase n=1 Tax=Pneumocystis murina (strain B123) TaxID=1069680 RepID=M7P8D7_PNEMU|nr:adenylosuccinate synthase [Pneumocystis murina B123]EMR10140.1 adenylosuccinate synthase [Pneumocystis murina B123]
MATGQKVQDGVTVILGVQWGDEGKGKLVDILSREADLCARCQGGNNAGHTIVIGDQTYDFHILPSGMTSPNCLNLIGSGVVIHIPSFFAELEAIEKKGICTQNRIFVSDRAHLVLDYHQVIDELKELELGEYSIGTTKKGIGPAYSHKAERNGIRVHHLYDFSEFERLFRENFESCRRRYGQFEFDVEKEINKYREYAEKLRCYVVDAVYFIHSIMTTQKRILVEGANALMLDIDYGTYPYVTSSNTSIGGVCTGLGLPPKKIKNVIGVMKAYTTRVGSGPFPTELFDNIGEHLQRTGSEWGVTTGRKRRCGWLDLVLVRYSNWINGYSSLMITKLDVLDTLKEIKIGIAYKVNNKEIPYISADLKTFKNLVVEYKTLPGWLTKTSGCTSFDQLPIQAQTYVKFIEDFIGVKILYIGVGPSRNDIILR